MEVLGQVINVHGRDPWPWHGHSGTWCLSWALKDKQQWAGEGEGGIQKEYPGKNCRSESDQGIGGTKWCSVWLQWAVWEENGQSQEWRENSEPQLCELRQVISSCASVSSSTTYASSFLPCSVVVRAQWQNRSERILQPYPKVPAVRKTVVLV